MFGCTYIHMCMYACVYMNIQRIFLGLYPCLKNMYIHSSSALTWSVRIKNQEMCICDVQQRLCIANYGRHSGKLGR